MDYNRKKFFNNNDDDVDIKNIVDLTKQSFKILEDLTNGNITPEDAEAYYKSSISIMKILGMGLSHMEKAKELGFNIDNINLLEDGKENSN